VIRFKVKPDPKRAYFFHVKVFDTIKRMRANAAQHGCLSGGLDGEPVAQWKWAALSHGHTAIKVEKGKRDRTTPELGIMWFSFELLSAEIVSHECTHSALRWAKRVRLKVNGRHMDEREERFCYAQGEMVGQFWREIYRLAPARYLQVKGRKPR